MSKNCARILIAVTQVVEHPEILLFILISDKEKPQIFSFKKLEPASV